jgi:hypothetical protein
MIVPKLVRRCDARCKRNTIVSFKMKMMITGQKYDFSNNAVYLMISNGLPDTGGGGVEPTTKAFLTF